MGYEIWDLETGNLLADFDDRTDALALIREEVEGKGPAAVDHMGLLYVYDEGRSTHVLAEGKALLDLIQTATATG